MCYLLWTSVLRVGPEGRELLGVLGFVLSLHPGPFPEESASGFQGCSRGKQGWVCLFPVNSDNGCIENVIFKEDEKEQD